LVINWFNPPGGPMVALAAWLFTATSRLYPGGEGDRRAFHYFALIVFVGIAYVPAMLLLTPLLSNYAILNLWLFVTLFVFGYLTSTVPGMNFAMQFALLMIVGTLGLNPQYPVTVQQILNVPLGLSIGILISAVVQRLFWPVLPQFELRDGFRELLGHCRVILRQGVGRDTFWRGSRIALLPVEITNWLRTLTTPDCPKDEPPRLQAYLESLQRTACAIMACTQRIRPLIPASSLKEGDRALAALEDAIDTEIASQQIHFASPDKDPAPPSLTALENARSEWNAFVSTMREHMLASDTPVTISLPFLGLADRYDRACDALIEARNRASQLRLDAYMGDYAL
jgi:uncharacterized membrane protein YccC